MTMQYALKVFEAESRRPFRIIDRNGEPWFVLADVCAELGLANPSDAASGLDPDERDTIANTEGIASKRVQTLVIVSESGLYSLIFKSRKAEAKRFKKWVTSEVLPSIRRTGTFRGGTPAFIRRYNANWDRVEKNHFSVINELAVRLWGRFEQLGHILADNAADGTENRPDVSVGRLFSGWLKTNHEDVCEEYSYYQHWTPEAEIPARQYPNKMLALYLEFVDNVWIPHHAERYLKTRDPAALSYLSKLLPPPQPRRKILGRR
jgi:prophage antirepressor-like protein